MKRLHKFLTVYEDWMAGKFYWTFKTKRYFGNDVDRVKETLMVTPHPQQPPRGQIIINDL